MSTRILTIDIQQEQIISVLLNYEQKGIQLLDSVFCALPESAEQNDESSSDLSHALSEISGKIENSMYDRCVVSIPANHFFFRTLELPFKNSKKIKQIIPFEMENYLPLEASTFEFDFCILHNTNKTSPDSNMVSIVGIEKDRLEQYKTFLSAGNISPEGITIGGGYSIALVFASITDQAAIFVYTEALFASIYIIYSGQIAFCRSFVLDPDEAESSVEKNLIYTYLSFNEGFKASMPLNAIAISGTAPFLETLTQSIETNMQLRVQVFNIFEVLNIRYGNDNKQSQHYHQIHNAIATAQIEIKNIDGYNFSSKIPGFSEVYQEHKSGILSSMLLAIILLIIYSVQPLININLMEKRIEDLDKNIVRIFQSDFPKITNIVDPVHQMQVKIEELQKKKSMDFTGEFHLNIDILNEISKTLPSKMDIIITRFTRTENTLLVSGSADQFNTIDKMKNYFDKIVFFKNVDINSATMDKRDNRVKFNLKILI
jgi:general secretion pathway protein L